MAPEINLNESEIDLNESKIDLNESKIDLNESEINLFSKLHQTLIQLISWEQHPHKAEKN